MKLEHTQTKSEVRQAIVRQIEEEIEQNPRNNYMVSLPAGKLVHGKHGASDFLETEETQAHATLL